MKYNFLEYRKQTEEVFNKTFGDTPNKRMSMICKRFSEASEKRSILGKEIRILF